MPSRSRPLLVLHDAGQLARVESYAPAALDGEVIAFDTDIHLLLRERGVPHRTPWDVIDRQEHPALEAYGAAVWRHWLDHARLDFEGMNLLHMALIRHHSALARLAWMAYAARRFTEVLRPDAVFVFEEPPAHGLDQPVTHRTLPLLSGMLRAAAEDCGCAIQVIPRNPREEGAFDDRVARFDQAVHEQVDVAAALEDRPYLLLQANRTDLLRQLPLIRAFRESTGCQCVQLYREADAEIVAEAAAQGQFVWHESQVAPMAAVPRIEATARRFRAAFHRAASALPRDLRLIYANSHVASHFDFLFGEYAGKLALHVRRWRAFLSAARPVAFVSNYHAPIFDVAASLGLQCLGLTHALMMIGQPDWFATLPAESQIGAISELHRERLIEAGVAAERISVTGDPWVDQVRDREDEHISTVASRVATRARLGIKSHRRMVLICTGSYGMPSKTTILPEIDWAEGVRNMVELAALTRRRRDLAFVIKCHPRFDYAHFYRRLAEEAPREARLIIAGDESLSDLAHAADVICVWNTITSALVEAALHPRPVSVFSRALVWYDAHRWGVDGWPHFEDVASIEAEIDGVTTHEDYRTRRIAQSREALECFLGDPGQSFAARCMSALQNFALAPAGAI